MTIACNYRKIKKYLKYPICEELPTLNSSKNIKNSPKIENRFFFLFSFLSLSFFMLLSFFLFLFFFLSFKPFQEFCKPAVPRINSRISTEALNLAPQRILLPEWIDDTTQHIKVA